MIDNHRYRRPTKRVLALAMLLVVAFYLDAVQHPHYRNVTLREGDKPPSPINIPSSLPLGHSQISFDLYHLPLAPTALTFSIDDCVEDILINGRRVSIKDRPPCGIPFTFTIRPPGLSYGSNTVRINARNLNGPGRVNVVPRASILATFCARIVLIFSIIIAAASIPQHASHLPRWAVRTIPICVGILSLELLSRWVFSTPSISSRLFDGGSASLRIKWILRNPSKPQLSYAIDAYDPILGWRLRQALDGKPPLPPGITSTPDGTRSIPTSRQDSDALTPHIMMFGDSFTFGEEVTDSEAYPSIFAMRAPEFRVTNCGVHGYGHDQMLLYLQEVLAKHKPKFVTLGFMRWDVQRNVMTFRDYAKPRFVLTSGAEPSIELTHVPIPSPEEMQRYMLGSRFGFLLSLLPERFDRIWNGASKHEEEAHLTVRILSEFAQVARKHGATPLFVYLPDRIELDRPATSRLPFFAQICRRSRVACVNTVPRFAAVPDRDSLFSPQGHYSGKGNSLVAETLVSFFRNQPDIRNNDASPPEN